MARNKKYSYSRAECGDDCCTSSNYPFQYNCKDMYLPVKRSASVSLIVRLNCICILTTPPFARSTSIAGESAFQRPTLLYVYPASPPPSARMTSIFHSSILKHRSSVRLYNIPTIPFSPYPYNIKLSLYTRPFFRRSDRRL